MKSALFVLTLVAASSSFGLVREQAACMTSDGAYTLNITENQGSGMHRPNPGPMTAILKDAQGNVVLTQAVEIFQGLQSISFGRGQYRDIQTSGDVLKIEGPSTNFKNYILNADVNGQVVHDENLSCSVFFGDIL